VNLTSVYCQINSEMSFPVSLNMKEFLSPNATDKDSTVYDLKSVVVHFGEPGFGHYITLARTNSTHVPETWTKFDDSRVTTNLTFDQVQELSFGGGGKPSSKLGKGSAYLLLYEKVNKQ